MFSGGLEAFKSRVQSILAWGISSVVGDVIAHSTKTSCCRDPRVARQKEN